MTAFPQNGLIRVGGTEYSWTIKRWGGASTAYENLRGLAVSVALKEGVTKELTIEFPFKEFLFDAPPSQATFLKRLGACIEAGLAAGWVPSKRGKRFIYVVPED